MPILTYGALLSKSKALQDQVNRLTRLADCLLQESGIQKKVIVQLKQLYESCSKPSLKSTLGLKLCDRGHFGCKILHSRYNFVNCSPNHKVLVTQEAGTFNGSSNSKSTLKPKTHFERP